MKKRMMSLILVVMMLVLAACGSKSGSTQGAQSTDNKAAGATANSTENKTENKTEGQAAKQWAMGTSSSGSSPYVLGGALSKLMNEKQKLIKLSPQVTGGYEENISLISKGTVHVAQATLDQLNDLYASKGRYQGEEHKEIRALFNVALMPIHVAVLGNSDIKSNTDLKGKKVNIGSPKQASYTLALKYLETLGLTDKDIKAGSLSTKDAPGGLKDNQQEAIFLLSTLPLSGLVEVAVSKPIRLLPIDGKMADTYIEKMEGSLIKTKIPAKTYSGVTEDVETLASPIVLYVNQNASEEEVYQFTKTFWGNLDAFHKEFPAGASLTKELAVQGIKVPLHPGAEKYFKESGLKK